jgi:plasmid stabilization system protein ParE
VRLAVTDAAAADIAEAAAWYESRRRGFGDVFMAAVVGMLGQLVEHPLRHPLADPALRRALLPGFPCCIFYRCDEDQILVLAVLHGRRDPSRWRTRDG